MAQDCWRHMHPSSGGPYAESAGPTTTTMYADRKNDTLESEQFCGKTPRPERAGPDRQKTLSEEARVFPTRPQGRMTCVYRVKSGWG